MPNWWNRRTRSEGPTKAKRKGNKRARHWQRGTYRLSTDNVARERGGLYPSCIKPAKLGLAFKAFFIIIIIIFLCFKISFFVRVLIRCDLRASEARSHFHWCPFLWLVLSVVIRCRFREASVPPGTSTTGAAFPRTYTIWLNTKPAPDWPSLGESLPNRSNSPLHDTVKSPVYISFFCSRITLDGSFANVRRAYLLKC